MSLREKMAGCKTSYFHILVAVPVSEGPQGRPVGVIEVSLAGDEPVLRHIMAASAARAIQAAEYGWISSMAVAGVYRRQGCASAMLEQAESIVRAWGARWLGLQVEPSNDAAWPLYRRCGFDSAAPPHRHFWHPWAAATVTLLKPLP